MPCPVAARQRNPQYFHRLRTGWALLRTSHPHICAQAAGSGPLARQAGRPPGRLATRPAGRSGSARRSLRAGPACRMRESGLGLDEIPGRQPTGCPARRGGQAVRATYRRPRASDRLRAARPGDAGITWLAGGNPAMSQAAAGIDMARSIWPIRKHYSLQMTARNLFYLPAAAASSLTHVVSTETHPDSIVIPPRRLYSAH